MHPRSVHPTSPHLHQKSATHHKSPTKTQLFKGGTTERKQGQKVFFQTECEYLDEGTPAKPLQSSKAPLNQSPKVPHDMVYVAQISASQNSLLSFGSSNPESKLAASQYATQQSPRLSKRSFKQCEECGRSFPEEILSKHVVGCLQMKQKTPETQWKKRCYFNQVELDNHQIVQIFAPGPVQVTTEARQDSSGSAEHAFEQQQNQFESSIDLDVCMQAPHQEIQSFLDDDQNHGPFNASGSFEIEELMVQAMHNHPEQLPASGQK